MYIYHTWILWVRETHGELSHDSQAVQLEIVFSEGETPVLRHQWLREGLDRFVMICPKSKQKKTHELQSHESWFAILMLMSSCCLPCSCTWSSSSSSSCCCCCCCCSLRPLVRAHFFRRTPQWKSGVYVHFAHWACGFVYLEAGVVFAHVLCTEWYTAWYTHFTHVQRFGTYFTHAQT